MCYGRQTFSFPEGYGKMTKRGSERRTVTDWIRSINKLPRCCARWCWSNFHMNIAFPRDAPPPFALLDIRKTFLFCFLCSPNCLPFVSSMLRHINHNPEGARRGEVVLLSWQFHLCSVAWKGKKGKHSPTTSCPRHKKPITSMIHGRWDGKTMKFLAVNSPATANFSLLFVFVVKELKFAHPKNNKLGRDNKARCTSNCASSRAKTKINQRRRREPQTKSNKNWRKSWIFI